MDDWQKIKQHLSSRVPWESFQSWFSQTSFRGYNSGKLQVTVPNPETKDWIEREFGPQVQSAAADLKLGFTQVEFVLPGSGPVANGSTAMAGPSALGEPAAAAGEPLFGASTTQLNGRYTFDEFVVGSCNQFAHAAAKAVAEQPARRYNPLFIYGGAGLGKTHLMHAIGRALTDQSPKLRLVYTTSERFMNQLIQCIRTDRMPLFHQFYRSADVLLIDDIHTLSGKERTQEEFFHTFNDLYDHQKQIVLTSDTAPKQISGLVERLRSRFEWGLQVDLQPPDLETRLAILQKKAHSEGVDLPMEVANLIATRTKSSVRELEGALVKLIAWSSVTASPISIEMARQALKQFTNGPEKRITIDAVLRATAENFGLQPAQIKQKTNVRTIAYPRQVAMYVAKEMTPASLPEIGRAFGGKHHTTVLHSVQKIERERHQNPDLERIINTIMDSLH